MEDRSLEHPLHLSAQHAPTSQGPLHKIPAGVSARGPTPPTSSDFSTPVYQEFLLKANSEGSHARAAKMPSQAALLKSHAPSVRLRTQAPPPDPLHWPSSLRTRDFTCSLTASRLERKLGPRTFPGRGLHPMLPVGTKEVHMVTFSSRPGPHWAELLEGSHEREP